MRVPLVLATKSGLLTGLAALVVALLCIALGPAVLAELDLHVYDSLQRVSTPSNTPPAVTIVAIDEQSLATYGRWPWPREVLADLIDRLHGLGASVVALDVLLAEPERHPAGAVPAVGAAPSVTGDDRLAGALSRSRAVTAYAFVFEGEESASPCTPRPLPLVERVRQAEALAEGLPHASAAVCGIAPFEQAAAGSGFVNSMADTDGLLRRTPLLVAYQGVVYPALALAAAQQALGGAPLIVEQRFDGGFDMRVGARVVRMDQKGRVLLRHRGLAPRISAADVLAGRASTGAVRGTVALVGPTALGLGDVVETPRDAALPGVEIHATAIDGLLAGRLNTRLPYAPIGDAVIACLFGAAALFVSWRLGHFWGALASLALLACAWAAAGVALDRWGVYVSPVYSMVTIAGALLFETGRGIVRERRRKVAAQRLIVQTLTSLTETRSVETGRHARRTEEYARLLTTALARKAAYRDQLTLDRIALIAALAPLHDIGKVGVSDAVLNKTTMLTAAETAEMRRHPALGHESLVKAEALAGVHDDEVLVLAKEIVHTHHERWDGAGYPRGLRGADIPLAGRIVAVVDVYDALVVERPYRRALTHARAVEIISEGRGTHFDPDVVDAFLSVGSDFQSLATRTKPPATARGPRDSEHYARGLDVV